MASIVFSTKKDALIALVKTKHCPAVKYVSRSSSYTDLRNLLLFYNETFACDPAYLDAIFFIYDDDAVRVGQGVYYNKNQADLNNPVFVAKSTITNEILIDVGGNVARLYIYQDSVINRIRVANNTILDTVIVGGDSQVDDIVVEDGSKINYLRVRSCFDGTTALHPSTVTIIDGRNILEVSSEEGVILTIKCVTPDLF